MAKKKQALSLAALHAQVQKYGTKELGYTDSGLWSFLPFVFTKDSHDRDNPVKTLPVAEQTFLKIAFLYMLCCQVLAIPKSRQMMMSWAMSAFATWFAMSSKYSKVVYQTKKEGDGFDMVTHGRKNPASGRMDFIIQHLPEWLQDPNIIAGNGNMVGKLVFSPLQTDKGGLEIPWHGSDIEAVPQGADQVRGKTLSLFCSDESAFQDAFNKVMVALLPAIKGGGKVLAVSSVDAGSDFNRMVLESVDGKEAKHEVHPTVQLALDLMGWEWPKGMKSWQTPAGVWCLEIHYTADPFKDPDRFGAEWFAEATKGYIGGVESSGWKTEMEINYNAGGGNPVYPFLESDACPVFIPEIAYESAINRFEFYAGYDYGSTNPSHFGVWGIDRRNHAYKVWELHEPCEDLGAHCDRIKACPYWDQIKYIKCDPSMTAKTQQTADGKKSLHELFAKEGVKMSAGRRGADVPHAIRMKSQHWSDPLKPTAFICYNCPETIKEYKDLRWAKHYSDGVARRSNNLETIMDKDNHSHDSDAYVLDTAPMPFVVPVTDWSPGLTMDSALKILEEKEYDDRTRYGGIHVC